MFVVIEKNVEDGCAIETVRVVGPFDEPSEACDWIEGQGEDPEETIRFEVEEVIYPCQ